MWGASLTNISLAVSIAVIICMAIAFALLFLLYGRTKEKSIVFGVEDEALEAQLNKDYRKFQEKYRENADANAQAMTFRSYVERQQRGCKPLRIVSDVVFGILIAFFIAVAITAIVFRAQGEQLYLGGKAFYTVQTGSMSEKSPANPHYENLPDNQLETYSLIAVQKSKQEDLKLYDIIAFRAEGRVYIHRIVEINVRDGKAFYSTMGDANSGAYTFERDIPYENVIGKYTGYSNFGLGCVFIYINSDIGLIAIFFALMLLIVVDLVEARINRRYEERLLIIADRMDGAKESAEEITEEPAVESEAQPEEKETPAEEKATAEQENVPNEVLATEMPEEIFVDDTDESDIDEDFGNEEADSDDDWEESSTIPLPDDLETFTAEDHVRYVVRYQKSFMAKLAQSDDQTKEWYTKIKNELLSYSKGKSRIGQRKENFRCGRKTAARLYFRGRTLCLWLPMSAEPYADTKYKVEDATKDEASALMYRIRNNRRAKYAVDLIRASMEQAGVAKGAAVEKDWYEPYRGDAVLLEEGLMQRKVVPASKKHPFARNRATEEPSCETESANLETNVSAQSGIGQDHANRAENAVGQENSCETVNAIEQNRASEAENTAEQENSCEDVNMAEETQGLAADSVVEQNVPAETEETAAGEIPHE